MIVLYIILAVLVLLLAVVLLCTAAFHPKAEAFRTYAPVEFDREAAVTNLQRLIRCRTVSYIDASKEDPAEFEKLIALLPELYPHVYEKCTLTRLPDRGLLFYWAGKAHDEASVMMAHFDVVPVEEENWKKPPFEGIIEDGVLRGRGTLDTKVTYNGVLTAAAHLIAQGFQPEQDIYFAFSGQEEINGPGAVNIVHWFQEHNINIQLVVDALEVAFTNPLIDSFCIVSGDSDYTPLVGRLKSMGKFVLGISRSEAASTVFIYACNEFQFLEGVSGRTVAPAAPKKHRASTEEAADEAELNKLIVSILEESADTDGMYASELKGILLRLRPDFNEKSYGCSSFGKLLTKLSQRFGELRVKNDNFNMMVNLNSAESAEGRPQLTKDNWREAFAAQLQAYKDGGFERVNPSILKADILTSYPDFTERSIGFKRFSDVMKQLEKDGLVVVEMDEQKTMLIKLL